MVAPGGLVLACPECGEVPHRVLRGKVTGKADVVFEGVVRCTSCGRVSSVVQREPRPIEVPLIVSSGGGSERTTLELGPDELVEIGRTFEGPSGTIRITSLESARGRARSLVARDVRTIWAKRADRIRVLFSVNKGSRTVSRSLVALPDEEFLVGDIVDLGRDRAVIHRIKVRDRVLRRGSARADAIVRVYGRVVKERTSH